MRSVLFAFTLASYVSSSTSDCWSPSAPAFSSCSVCPSTGLKGKQCSRSGKTLTCYESVEVCCKDADVLSHVTQEVCLASSKKIPADITPFEDDSDSDSEDDEGDLIEEECKRVVAISSATSNRHCMSDCSRLVKQGVSPIKDPSWSKLCMPSHWHEENGRAVPEGSCFQKWVYGYSEPADRASVKTNMTAETPALCQAMCQEDVDCVNWLWVTPLYTPGTETASRCLLKSKTMVEKPLAIITDTQPPTNLDVAYCNAQMGDSCQNGFNCLRCDGKRRCVWESDLHISGWKYCGHSDSCRAEEDEVITEECKRVVARTSSTTNRHCMSECSRLVKAGVSPIKDQSWSQLCMPSHWHEDNGRAIPEGSCFQKWVYGYSEPAAQASTKMGVTAETPALCQALCQEDSDCAAWLWVTPLYTPGTEIANRCMLKSKAMVEKSLAVITETQPPANLDATYCNAQIGTSCQNGFKCLTCDGQRRCVWESDLHISGWKYCDHSDSCHADALSPARAMTQPSTLRMQTVWQRVQDARSGSIVSPPSRDGNGAMSVKDNATQRSVTITAARDVKK